MEEFFDIKRMISKKNIIILVTIMLLLGTIFVQNVLDKEITIKDGDKVITVHTLSSRIDSVLNKAQVKLNEYDKLSISEETRLEDGMNIEVFRAFPIIIKDEGNDLEVLTANNKVGDILKQYNIELDENDKVEPTLDSKIKPNDVIDVIRVKEEIVKETVSIPYKSIIKYREDVDYGKQKRVQEGKLGQKEVEYKIVYENGQEVIREIIHENIINKPLDEIIEKGAEKYLVASRGQVVRYKKVIVMSSTAYDLSYQSTGKNPGDPYYGITRSGTKARPGVVAVDPKVIPLGTKLYIESLDGAADYGYASAEDTGSAIKGNKIDLFMENHKAAMRYGRRNVKVYVLE